MQGPAPPGTQLSMSTGREGSLTRRCGAVALRKEEIPVEDTN